MDIRMGLLRVRTGRKNLGIDARSEMASTGSDLTDSKGSRVHVGDDDADRIPF